MADSLSVVRVFFFFYVPVTAHRTSSWGVVNYPYYTVKHITVLHKMSFSQV